MGRVTASFGAVVFLCATVVWGFAARGEESKQGKTLYEQHCTLCHGADGKGSGPAAASLNPHPTDLTKPQFWVGGVDKKISETIRKGMGPMPSFKLSGSEITSIIDYMKSAFKK